MLVSILKIRSGHGSLNHKTGIHDVGCMKWLKPEGPLFSDESYAGCLDLMWPVTLLAPLAM